MLILKAYITENGSPSRNSNFRTDVAAHKKPGCAVRWMWLQYQFWPLADIQSSNMLGRKLKISILTSFEFFFSFKSSQVPQL